MVLNIPLQGVIHGKTIELERESGLPDGTRVHIAVQLEESLPVGEGIRRSFGGWADDKPEELDKFLADIRAARDNDPRPDPAI